jgi:phage terminase small subunit
MVDKPASIAASTVKSRKWDELTAGRKFQDSDMPALELLCQWYAIVDRCLSDMDSDGDIEVAYTNQFNDIKPLPQVGMLKQASAEIRALNKQLGINDTNQDNQPKKKETTLYVIQTNRQSKATNKPHSKTG